MKRAALTGTVGRHVAETAVQGLVGTICLNHIGRVRNKQAQRTKGQLEIEVMVNHVHAIRSVLGVESWRSLDGTGEVAVGGGEGRLPHLRELVHKPGDGSLVGTVVHEEDGALVLQDHFGEGGPVV